MDFKHYQYVLKVAELQNMTKAANGTVMGNLREEDIIICDLEGKILEGDKKPSKETQMHLEVYRKCPEVRTVVHTSPFYSTFCACMPRPVKTNLFIESMYYGENMQRIPYFHAGSKELAQAVKEVCDRSHVILMEHHGVLVYDTKLSECRTGLEVTENICKMNILAGCGNLPLSESPMRNHSLTPMRESSLVKLMEMQSGYPARLAGKNGPAETETGAMKTPYYLIPD